jgi:hypothetical protein
MEHRRRAVMPLIRGDAPSVFRGLDRLAQRGVIACFDTPAIVQPVVWQDLDRRCMGPQAVRGAQAFQVRVVLTSLGHEPFGGMALTSSVARSIVCHERFRHHGNHCTAIRMDARGAHPLLSLRHAAVTVDLWQT